MYIGLQVKYPTFLSEFNGIAISRYRFSENTQISNFIKMCPVGGKLFYADVKKKISLFSILRKCLKELIQF